jgi:hypothetical protein
VFIHTIARTPDRSHPFVLIISYGLQGFVAGFLLEANQVAQQLVACPSQTSPWISIIAPNLPWTIEQIEDEFVGLDPNEPMRAIEEASVLSVEAFHDLFRVPAEAACISTPMALW